jgi:hypothetical protein
MRDVQELVYHRFHDFRILERLHYLGPHEAVFLRGDGMLTRRVEGKAIFYDLQHRFIVALGFQTMFEGSLAVEVFLEELMSTRASAKPL